MWKFTVCALAPFANATPSARTIDATTRRVTRRLDAGSSWRDLAADLPGDFLRRVDRYTKEVWINLLGLPYDHPEGRTGASLLATIRSLPTVPLSR